MTFSCICDDTTKFLFAPLGLHHTSVVANIGGLLFWLLSTSSVRECDVADVDLEIQPAFANGCFVAAAGSNAQLVFTGEWFIRAHRIACMIVLDLRSGFACGLTSNTECSADHLQTGGAKTRPVILSKKRVAAMSPDSALAEMWRPFLHVK